MRFGSIKIYDNDDASRYYILVSANILEDQIEYEKFQKYELFSLLDDCIFSQFHTVPFDFAKSMLYPRSIEIERERIYDRQEILQGRSILNLVIPDTEKLAAYIKDYRNTKMNSSHIPLIEKFIQKEGDQSM